MKIEEMEAIHYEYKIERNWGDADNPEWEETTWLGDPPKSRAGVQEKLNRIPEWKRSGYRVWELEIKTKTKIVQL